MSKSAQTVEQKIAEAEAQLARLREKKKKQEAGQKVVLGGMLLAAARDNDQYRKILIQLAEKYVTRRVDQERIQPLLDELRNKEEKPEKKERVVPQHDMSDMDRL